MCRCSQPYFNTTPDYEKFGKNEDDWGICMMATYNNEPPASWFSSALKAFLSIPSGLLGTTNEFTDVAIDLSESGPFSSARAYILEAHKEIIESVIRGLPLPGPESTPWLVWAMQFYIQEADKVSKLQNPKEKPSKIPEQQFGRFII